MIVVADEVRLKKDVLAYSVFDKLREIFPEDYTTLYYSFPLYRGDEAEEIISAPLLVVSKKIGVLFLFIKNDSSLLDNTQKTIFEEMDAHLFSKFSKRSELRRGKRDLAFPLNGIVVGTEDYEEDDIQYVSRNNLKSYIEKNSIDMLSDDDYTLILSCIEGTTKIKNKKPQRISPEGDGRKRKTKADILNNLQNVAAHFDLVQKRVALITIDGPQRIRGLAGSGKTILLTMKAAQYHLAHPDEEILYTYYTKSLHGLILNQIERFYRDFSDNQEPNWKKIHVMHGWGSDALPGVYSETCYRHGFTPQNYGYALSKRTGTESSPFGFVCQELMSNAIIKPYYDLTLIDEGQDFPNEFYRLCYRLTKNRRLVWAYDDFQNIFKVKIQDEKHTFGNDDNGNPLVSFDTKGHPLQDIVLHTCYRTPRQILTAAFSLGLGIYNTKVLQRIPYNRNWEALGFKVEKGNSEKAGDEMVISRPEEFSPSFLNSELSGEIVHWECFDSYEKECQYVVDKIINDINIEGLRADDICVICLDEKYMKGYYQTIEYLLTSNGINCFNMLNAPNNNTQFFYDHKVTLSTVNRAKGNEAGMVYIVGADYVFVSANDVYRRNKLFTSMTRAKGWVSITGCNGLIKGIEEYQKLLENNGNLMFRQPSEEDTKTVMSDSFTNEEKLQEFKQLYDFLKSKGISEDEIFNYLKK